jgi:hypothetical protein
MKKIIVSILMITGLSLSSQVKNKLILTTITPKTINPIILATPQVENPASPIDNYIKCDAGPAHYNGGCATVGITCSNGNTYVLIFCPSEPVRLLPSERIINGTTVYNTDVNIDITSNVIDDSNTQLDPVARVINQRKILDAYVTLKEDLVFNYSSSTLIIKTGVYKVISGKLQVTCN